MELIIKPTERCNFKCTFCSSTHITEDKTNELSHEYIFRFLKRFPETNTIIVNGGDPLMMDPQYYWDIIKYLDDNNLSTGISFTSNLWPFYKNPNKWKELFNHPRMGITTSFQYGGGRLKGDLSEFSEEDFWNVSNAMLEHCGYRPDFIAVITEENEHLAIKNVELAKKMGVECKLNYAFSSGPPVKFKNIIMGQEGNPYMLADIYAIYVEIWKQGLTEWEYNTKQMVKRLKGYTTTCPQNRNCDAGIRTLQPTGDYYSCGAFGDDRQYSIDFEKEMNGVKIFPLKFQLELQSLKQSCFTCPMFDICNGCKKTIKDLKEHNLVEAHCAKMKAIAADIIESNNLTGILVPTEYVKEYV
jgi:radical SAM protein with 4Fe4S-binding SPASM domain